MMRVACRATSAGDAARVRAGGDQRRRPARAAAVHDERIAGLEKIVGHGLAHEAETDEANRWRHLGKYSEASRGRGHQASGAFSESARSSDPCPESRGLRPEAFEAAILHNARESLDAGPGLLRFDVSQQLDDPRRWVLHEVYTSADAHAAHRRSPHFLAYNAVAERAVLEKTVVTVYRQAPLSRYVSEPLGSEARRRTGERLRQACAPTRARNPNQTCDLGGRGRIVSPELCLIMATRGL